MCPILHKIVCIDLKCNGCVLVSIEVELIHLYVQNVLDQFELKLIQILLRPEKKCTVVWPSVGMIITSNGRSQQTHSA
jgi:hypothetical protein